jgi:hypothetical protein
MHPSPHAILSMCLYIVIHGSACQSRIPRLCHGLYLGAGCCQSLLAIGRLAPIGKSQLISRTICTIANECIMQYTGRVVAKGGHRDSDTVGFESIYPSRGTGTLVGVGQKVKLRKSSGSVPDECDRAGQNVRHGWQVHRPAAASKCIAHMYSVSTVNSDDIRNYENQIGKAREESARAEKQVAQIESERKKRSSEREKLQDALVSHRRAEA